MREQLFSFGYKQIRSLIKQQKASKHGTNLEPVIDWGHQSIETLSKSKLSSLLFEFKIPSSLKRNIYDLEFPSPLTFSAYEAHWPLLHCFLQLGIGGGCLKTMMTQAREGNPKPRIAEVKIDGKPALVNALGLPGKGVKTLCEELLSSPLLSFNRPIGLSIGGDTLEGYKESADIYISQLDHLSFPLYYEINISCPNTDEGQDLSKDTDLLASLLDHIQSKTSRMVTVKVSPMQSNGELCQIAEMMRLRNNVCINAGNTQFRTCKELQLPNTALPRGGGGLSGAPLFNRTLEMVGLLAPFKLPIIATGGIDSAEKVQAVMNSGASLVGMATALAFDPYTIVKINKELA